MKERFPNDQSPKGDSTATILSMFANKQNNVITILCVMYGSAMCV